MVRHVVVRDGLHMQLCKSGYELMYLRNDPHLINFLGGVKNPLAIVSLMRPKAWLHVCFVCVSYVADTRFRTISCHVCSSRGPNGYQRVRF